MKQNYQNDEFLAKRQERQRKLKKRRLKVFFTLFILLLLFVGVILSLTVLFPINKITAKGSKIYTQAEIIASCGIETGDNLFTVSKKEALDLLKKRLPFIETVEFERSLPDTLNLKVTDAKEYACYIVGDKYYTVSKDGWTLNSYTEKPQNVILIVTDKVKCKVGNAIQFENDNSHSEVQNLIELLSKYDIDVDNVDITDSVNLKAKIEGRFIVNFGTQVDLEQKIKHLDSMIKEIDQNDTGKINLSMWNSQNTQGTFVQTDIK
ncbi:MAG: FtsQ-type POTRA domain-containing protein [Clostridia bacterium]|nr:FtsQ-type POTRA domain-containing protein [Clostridia bacterium]